MVAGSCETLDKQWPKIAWSSYFCCKFTGYFYRQLKGSRPIFQRKASLYSGLATANSRKLFQNPIQKLISYLVPRLLGKSDTFLVWFETVTVLALGFQCRSNLSAVVNIYVVIATSRLPQTNFFSRSPNFNLKQGISYAEFRVSGWFIVCDCGSSYSFFGCGMWGQNRRQKVFNRGALDFCGVAWYSKNWQKVNWFIVCHVLIWGVLKHCLGGGLKHCLGGLSP